MAGFTDEYSPKPAWLASGNNVAIEALPIIKYHYAMARQLAKLKGVTP